MRSLSEKLIDWLPDLDRQVWILMVGRLLSQLGTGFILFYAPIYFANQVGLSEAAVGLGIGLGSVTGIAGRILGGTLADTPRWGRRKTLLFSAVVSAIADFILAVSSTFPLFLAGNLLMGFGVGLYWPANESVVADRTSLAQRNDAFALTRLADNLGIGLGVVLGGWLIAATGMYQALFWIDGISYVLFAAVVFWSIAESLPSHLSSPSALAQRSIEPVTERSIEPVIERSIEPVTERSTEQRSLQGWHIALRDRILLRFALVNILFTTYLALSQTALPLYFANFIPAQANGQGFDAKVLSALFAWNVILTTLLQLPVARWLNRGSHPIALMISAGFWALSFGLVGLAGVVSSHHLLWASFSMLAIAIASVAYLPTASAFVVELAPATVRGVYLSMNSLCWAVGYFLGPTLGGWAMSRSVQAAHGFWFVLVLTVIGALAILRTIQKMQ